MKDILNDLNDIQKKAVECINGPSMVIAGAGSGKTRVLTYRVAHLLNKGIDPFNILSLTFTNKAAREMKERILKLVGSADAKNVWMGTFHSIFARILRIESEKLGFPSNFSIYDTEDSKRLLRKVVKEMDLDPKIYAPGYILARISSSKTNLISAPEYLNNAEFREHDRSAGKPMLGEIYSSYQNRLTKSAAMDFDDLLYYTNILLRDHPTVLYKYQKKFRYILVDEYQDTNYSQYLIIKKLSADNENICVVGDDAQSIYAFRGANIKNILNFKYDYPDLKIFKLEQNYRSTQNIIKAANSVIANNKDQIFKEIWTENESGKKISLFKATTDNEEGSLIANSIFEFKMNYQLANDAFAILYRTNAQSRALEEALRKLNIPYHIYGGLSFYKRKEIKDLIAYFRLVINKADEDALNRIINTPARGIGKTTLEKIIVKAAELNKSLWEILENHEHFQLNFNQGTASKLSAFVIMIKSFSTQLKNKNAYELGKHIASSSGLLKDLYNDKTPEGISRFENIEELLNAMKDFSERENSETVNQEDNDIRTLEQFIQDIALLTDADTEDKKKDTNRVSLMTIHAAKGLEFPFVYVTGLEENLFPSIQSLNSRFDLEEERRLFYVAITRAKENLTLSYAENRYRWGNLTLCEPSRFIDEIEARFLETPKKAPTHKTDKGSFLSKDDPHKTFIFHKNKRLKKINPAPGYSKTQDPAFHSEGLDELQTGMEVEHQRFGKGKVINLEGNGSNKKATVFFKSTGQKQLLLKFAKLKIINKK